MGRKHPPKQLYHWDLACFVCYTEESIEWERETWKAVMAGRDARLIEDRNQTEAIVMEKGDRANAGRGLGSKGHTPAGPRVPTFY